MKEQNNKQIICTGVPSGGGVRKAFINQSVWKGEIKKITFKLLSDDPKDMYIGITSRKFENYSNNTNIVGYDKDEYSF